jgi:hypothetical protein
VSQSEIHRRSLSVYGQKAVSRQEVSGCRNWFKGDKAELNDDPQRHRDRTRTSHTERNCFIVESLIKEDHRE